MKVGKPPINPLNGTFLKSSDQSSWFPYETCRERIVTLSMARGRTTPGFDPAANVKGLGLFHGAVNDEGRASNLTTIDFDFKALPRDDARWVWARDWLRRFDMSFTQTSPSGQGCHVMGWASDELRSRIGATRPVRGCIDIIAQMGFLTITSVENTLRNLPLADISEPLAALLDAEGITAAPPVAPSPPGTLEGLEAYYAACRLDKRFQPLLCRTVEPGNRNYNFAVTTLAGTLKQAGATEMAAYQIILEATITRRSPPSAKGEARDDKLHRLFFGPKPIWERLK